MQNDPKSGKKLYTVAFEVSRKYLRDLGLVIRANLGVGRLQRQKLISSGKNVTF